MYLQSHSPLVAIVLIGICCSLPVTGHKNKHGGKSMPSLGEVPSRTASDASGKSDDGGGDHMMSMQETGEKSKVSDDALGLSGGRGLGDGKSNGPTGGFGGSQYGSSGGGYGHNGKGGGFGAPFGGGGFGGNQLSPSFGGNKYGGFGGSPFGYGAGISGQPQGFGYGGQPLGQGGAFGFGGQQRFGFAGVQPGYGGFQPGYSGGFQQGFGAGPAGLQGSFGGQPYGPFGSQQNGRFGSGVNPYFV